MRGWIGCDLDGTLAHYDGWKGVGHIGEPVPAMVERVKRHLADGETVKLVTARACRKEEDFDEFMGAWIPWSLKHLGKVLPVTNEKDFGMIFLYDDRAVQIIPNTGRRADGLPL